MRLYEGESFINSSCNAFDMEHRDNPIQAKDSFVTKPERDNYNERKEIAIGLLGGIGLAVVGAAAYGIGRFFDIETVQVAGGISAGLGVITSGFSFLYGVAVAGEDRSDGGRGGDGPCVPFG